MATLSSNSASTSTQLSCPAKNLSEEEDRRRKSSVHEGPACAKLGSNGFSQGYSITASHQRISGNIWANSSAASPVSSASLRKLQPHRTNLLALFSICYAQRRHTTGAFLTNLKRIPSGVPNAGSLASCPARLSGHPRRKRSMFPGSRLASGIQGPNWPRRISCPMGFQSVNFIGISLAAGGIHSRPAL